MQRGLSACGGLDTHRPTVLEVPRAPGMAQGSLLMWHLATNSPGSGQGDPSGRALTSGPPTGSVTSCFPASVTVSNEQPWFKVTSRMRS